MIFIDDRGHDPALIPYFRPYAPQVESATLDAADIAFVGNGEDGPAYFGIERKRIRDLVSSIRTERFSGFQLDKLLEYEYPMLLVEGIWRCGRDGSLEILNGSGFQPYFLGRTVFLYREVSNFLLSMQLVTKLTVIRTGSAEETAAMVAGMYASYTEKEWKQHKAGNGIYAPVPQAPGSNGHKASLLRRPKPSLVTKMAAQIPGIDTKAWEVGKKFRTPEDMLNASEKEWTEIEGIGKKGAKNIVAVLHGRN